MAAWTLRVEQEKARRAEQEQQSAVAAARQWIKADSRGYANAFAKLFIKKFAESRGYQYQRPLPVTLSNQKNTITGAVYYESVFAKPGAGNNDTATFGFLPNEAGDGMDVVYMTASFQVGVVQTDDLRIVPKDVQEMAAAVQKGLGRQAPNYKDPTEKLKPIEEEFPKPQMGTVAIPPRTNFVR